MAGGLAPSSLSSSSSSSTAVASVPVARKHKRPRPQTSCSICHRRKVKCDKRLPCDQCVKHGAPGKCFYASLGSDGRPLAAKQRRAVAERSARDDGQGELASVAGTPGSSVSAGGFAAAREGQHAVSEGEASVDVAAGVVHVWDAHHPKRGRTHYSWSLLKTESLVQGLGDLPPAPRRGHLPILLDTQTHGIMAEFPAAELCRRLAARYFETFGTVYELLDEREFNAMLERSLTEPEKTPLCVAIQSLIVFAIGNATLPLHPPVRVETIAERRIRLSRCAKSISRRSSC